MGFPKGASIPFGRERGSNPVRDFKLIKKFSELCDRGASMVNISSQDTLNSLKIKERRTW